MKYGFLLMIYYNDDVGFAVKGLEGKKHAKIDQSTREPAAAVSSQQEREPEREHFAKKARIVAAIII